MADLFPVTLDEQIASVRRELAMRANVYPRRVADKKMTQITADKETAHMQAVLVTLESLKAAGGVPRLKAPMQVVPTDPTEKMVAAGVAAGLDVGAVDDDREKVAGDVYRAMIGAAP